MSRRVNDVTIVGDGKEEKRLCPGQLGDDSGTLYVYLFVFVVVVAERGANKKLSTVCPLFIAYAVVIAVYFFF